MLYSLGDDGDMLIPMREFDRAFGPGYVALASHADYLTNLQRLSSPTFISFGQL